MRISDWSSDVCSSDLKPENWLAALTRNGHGIESEEPLAPRTRATEALLMGLRLDEGVDLARIATLGGTTPAALIDARAVDRLTREGLVEQLGDRLRVTGAGRRRHAGSLPAIENGRGSGRERGGKT